ncbi:NACHT domain-containing protein [Planktothrix mougeotii]|uniref:NACHT domain-containing protein n=1 Tax=Planktothrix mougeotii LEGE 06226 TaxID=1828728 RepID=A0ABR9U631_9CYAN|nr:NACHT domain-containing protein [Planktothrix mougeotii]MBE9141915.1 NACHT domain-containing protein [Planktothrix mougeotii LEGE 06226]
MPEMTPDEVLALLTPLFPSNGLSDTQELVLRESWQRKSYRQIATAFDYDTDYIKVVGSRLWRSLSQILGKPVTKANLHSVINCYAHQSKQGSSQYDIVSKPLATHDCSSCEKKRIAERLELEKMRESPNAYHLTAAIDVSCFYGRSTELSTLKHWILEEHCRLIAIVGMAGIGKTALSVKLTHEIKQQFEFVFLYNLNTGLSCSELLTEIFDNCLINAPPPKFSERIEVKVLQFIEYLQHHKCLIILDGFDTVFQDRMLTGNYRNGYEDYRKLLQQLGEINHQSCILITSRETPKKIAVLAGNTLPVRVLKLKGLDFEAGEKTLKLKEIKGTSLDYKKLVTYYSGNPLLLKIAAGSIQDIFNYSIAEFVQENQIIFNGIKAILDQQFNHLSELEKKIMYWLTIESKPVSSTQLVEDLFPPVSQPVLLESLESLQRRSLIQKKSLGFTQNYLIRAYLTERIIEHFYQDLTCENQKNTPRCCPLFFMLQNYPIFKTTANASVQNYQISAFVKPLIQKLLVRYKSSEDVAEQLNLILIKLREIKIPYGYAAGNLINLLCFLNTDLTGADFSGLPLWEGDLRCLNLEQINLKYCDLSQ